jgi:HEPN domain-containing protein
MERSADWLKQAKRDLEKAKLDFHHSFFEWACFTAQQSAEKAVKAVYQKLNMSVKGHSIVKMLEELQSADLKLSEELTTTPKRGGINLTLKGSSYYSV